VNVVFAVAIGALFGTGATLALKADLFRVIAGLLLISNATILTVMACGLTRGDPPILGEAEGTLSDPLVQAMALTALVIGFGTTALLLALARQVHETHDTVDLDELSRRQVEAAEAREREEVSV
jgi:multicomponent Na+:H+ antiporter subunit C